MSRLRGALRELVEGLREGWNEPRRQVVQMPLDWPCTKCSGRGTMPNHDVCDRCDGSGFALSPRGFELADFLTRHGFQRVLPRNQP